MLTVVTASLDGALLDRLLQRALARHSVSLVFVDAASFAPGAPRERHPALLRLQSVGVPVAVLRRGDDLATALSAPQAAAVAHA